LICRGVAVIFPIPRDGEVANLQTLQHPKGCNGTQKGVSVMSLIANHAAINARVIGANEHESHYIFDLLMNNSS
jgi:hypothetical protein